MSKTKKHFTGPEMSALSGPLTAAQTALATASFFIAARVANAAWSFVEALQAQPPNVHRSTEAMDALKAALHDYSPGNWPPPATFKTYAAQRLEELYAEAEQAPTREAVLEVLYQAISKEYDP
jgi:hypothetical protein